MPLDRKFISAEITEMAKGQAWICSITYSFYGLYEFTNTWVFNTQQECERKLLLERCNGFLTIKNKLGNIVSIKPDL